MKRSRTKKNAPLEMKLLDRASRNLRAMGHPVRLKLIELLLTEPICVSDLAEEIGAPSAAISQHLNMLRSHGIVSAEREGRQVFYEVCCPQAHYIIDCLRQHGHEM